MKQILIKISKSGIVGAETIGMTGTECLNVLSDIENLTNSITINSKYKREFFTPNDNIGSISVQCSDYVRNGAEQ